MINLYPVGVKKSFVIETLIKAVLHCQMFFVKKVDICIDFPNSDVVNQGLSKNQTNKLSCKYFYTVLCVPN